VLIEPTWD